MNRKIALLTFVGMAAATAAAHAQTLGQFTLNDGAFRYNERVLTLTSNRTGTGGGSADFGFASGAATATSIASDYLFQNWWWYRGPGDTREYGLSTQVAGIQLSPSSVFLRYEERVNNATPGAGLRFELTYTLNQITPTSAAVTINWSVTNLTGQDVDMSMFSYTDYDVLTAGDDFYSRTAGTGYDSIRADNTTTDNARFASVGADLRTPDAWQVGAFSGTGSPRTALSNANVDNLGNAILGVNPGDEAGAFQWNLRLTPAGTVGSTLGGRVTKGYNYSIPAPGALALVGLGGLIVGRRRR